MILVKEIKQEIVEQMLLAAYLAGYQTGWQMQRLDSPQVQKELQNVKKLLSTTL